MELKEGTLRLHNALKIEKAADLLASYRQSLTPIKSLPAELRPTNELEGYLLQEQVNRLLSIPLGARVGYKIGCTTPVMQRFLGIPSPCAGEIFSRTTLKNSGRVPRDGFIKIGIECEIVVSIAETISPHDFSKKPFSPSDVIDSLMVGMEIVDDRYVRYQTLGIPTLIADNFFDCGCVLGDPVSRWHDIDLKSLLGTTSVNGVVVGSGRGSLIMKSPLNALQWFIQSMMKRGAVINQGEFVMLGSVVETKWLEAGDVAEVEIESLGSVSLKVE